MNDAFLDELNHLIETEVRESLESQRAFLSRSEVEGLVRNRLREIASKLINIIQDMEGK